MKFLTLTAAGFVALASAAGASAEAPPQANAPAQTAGTIKVSPKAVGAISELQKAVNANDIASIPAKVAAAKAVAQTKDDHFAIAQLQLKAAVAAKDNAALARAVDEIAASGALPGDKVAGLYKDVGSELFNAKQYAASSAAFQKASTLAPADTEALSLLGRSMMLEGRPAAVVPIVQQAIKANSAGGAKAPEDLYRLGVQAAFDSKSPEASTIAREWLANYPSPDAWRNNLAIFRNLHRDSLDDDSTLALLRLMSATGGLTGAADARAYIDGLVEMSNFNEAHAALDSAIAANVLTPATDAALIASVKGKPIASVSDLMAASKTVQSANALLRIGDRLYGSGNYTDAVTLYRQAQARGANAATVNLYTGMALAKAGDRAGATAALKSVTGPSADIAQYWLIYLNQHS